MRFLAPARETIAADLFCQPVFTGLENYQDLLGSPHWPPTEQLNTRLLPIHHRIADRPLVFATQESLSDGLPYELRIFERGQIATRSNNWHDLFNALIWKNYPAIKSALNARQVADIVQVGARQRTRAQCALTQFDEAGAILVLRDTRLLSLWDTHDWAGLFYRQRDAWRDGRVTLHLFGHALLEHALQPGMLLVAKTLLVIDPTASILDTMIDAGTAAAIARRLCLNDPQELRPLPLSGIPGWHDGDQDAAFYRDKPCFRPLRPGRQYPAPLRF